MEPNYEIPEGVLDNVSEFTDPFYKRFKLRHRDEPVPMGNGIMKDYLFPTFYGDVTCAISIFMCDYDAAAELVAKNLHPKVKPIKMTKNRAVIAFSCYEYKKVLGVAPYNEIAMASPVSVNAKKVRKVLPLLKPKPEEHFGYYICGMPVTSEENKIRGHEIWGLPKVTQRIDIYREGDYCITEAYDKGEDKPYIRLKCPVKGKPKHFDVSSYLYTKYKGKIRRSETNFAQTFNVNMNLGLLFKQAPQISEDSEFIRLGSSPSAEMLKKLKIESIPFQTRYAEHMASCFDLPEEEMPDWLAELG